MRLQRISGIMAGGFARSQLNIGSSESLFSLSLKRNISLSPQFPYLITSLSLQSEISISISQFQVLKHTHSTAISTNQFITISPAMAAVAEVVSDQSSSHQASRELHVLAVDDSHVDRKVIERLLKISSCRVTAVESGTRALQCLGLDGDNTSVQFDDMKVNLIITDYSMPGMTGYELLKKIKESETFKEVPVVIMSSENILTRIDRCLEEGAEDYIVKPVKLSDVTRLKDFIMKGDGEENGEKRSHERKQGEEDGASVPSSSPLQPMKVSTIFALTTSSLLSSSPLSSESLAQKPKSSTSLWV